MIGKTISPARCCGRLTLQRFIYAHFSNLPWASDSEKWPKRSLAAGTLQFIGRVPKRPRMLAARNSFPGFLIIMLMAGWN